MSNPYISVVIPTCNRSGILAWTLSEFAKQSLGKVLFEVVIVNDGGADVTPPNKVLPFDVISCGYKENRGPAAARNFGVKHSRGEIILFVGDDCIPHKHLLFWHYSRHRSTDQTQKVVQGYTPWHPDIDNEFLKFLIDSGLQANWNGLKNQDGTWRSEAGGGWFLTTNVSIARNLFESEGGFDERFPAAAWEDIEFSYRLAKKNVPVLFAPNAINYHYHKHDLDSFINRQLVEGRSRLILCGLQPELTANLIDPEGLRQASHDALLQAVRQAKEINQPETPDLKELQTKRWNTACRIAALVGILDGIKDRGRAWQGLLHVHTNELARHVVATAWALDINDPDYAEYESQLALKNHPDNWALHAMLGEVKLARNDGYNAALCFQRAVELGPGEKWPADQLKSVTRVYKEASDLP